MSSRSEKERFWAKVDKSGDCWIWTAYVLPVGYGQFGIRKTKMALAHRYAYEDAIGPIPDGLDIDHMCHNRKCVNPAHLRAVTRKQNLENHSGANRTNLSGVRNVHFHKATQRYAVSVTHNGKSHYGGSFARLEEAAAAAKALRLSLHTHNDADRIPVTVKEDQSVRSERAEPESNL